MIVIKQGDIKRLEDCRTFECPICGCVFEVSRREYIPEYARNEVSYRATCPCCGKAVYGGQLVGGEVKAH